MKFCDLLLPTPEAGRLAKALRKKMTIIKILFLKNGGYFMLNLFLKILFIICINKFIDFFYKFIVC